MSTMRVRGQLGALWLVALAAAIALPGPTQLAAGFADPSAEVVLGAVIGGLAATLSWLLSLWGGIVMLAGALAHLPSVIGIAAHRVLAAVTPVAVRRVVGLALGLAILGTAPAYAATPGTSAQSDRVAVATGDLPVMGLDLDWLPTVPVAPVGVAAPGPTEVAETPQTGSGAPDTDSPAAGQSPSSGATSANSEQPVPRVRATVTVQPGDCLWAIASADLPATASAAEIDAAWRAWHLENLDVIGPDPNLLFPGQQLRAPADPAAAIPAETHIQGGPR